jgi:hypothetical protein
LLRYYEWKAAYPLVAIPWPVPSVIVERPYYAPEHRITGVLWLRLVSP